jgi:hypothetical protein
MQQMNGLYSMKGIHLVMKMNVNQKGAWRDDEETYHRESEAG